MGAEPQLNNGGTLPLANNKTVRFGVFEVNLRAGELRKGGMKIKLHGQPFAVLAMLLERPSEVVSREELQQKLWASDTYVDFEHGLNKAINKLREALGDDADNPRYIETLPRRGYRFVGSIAQPTTAQTPVTGEGTKQEKKASPPKTAKRKSWIAGAVCLCAVIAAAFFWLRAPSPPPRVLRYRQLTTDRQQKGITPCAFPGSLVTDGPRVFFSEPTASVAQVSSSGGDVVILTVPFSCFPFDDISPDKTELLGTSFVNGSAWDKPLWSLSIATGQARRLGNLTGHNGGWSADGQKFAYATGNDILGPNDVYVAAKDGSNPHKLVRIEKGYVGDIRWSPDGRVLRMTVVDQNVCSLWEVSADGTNLHPMNLFPGQRLEACSGNWTADGRYFVFNVFRDDPIGGEIWARRESQSRFFNRTSKPMQLTTGPVIFFSPTPSPDGKQIFAIGTQPRGELVRFDLKLLKLETYLSGISAEQLDFSRDGEWVAYVTFPEAILWRSRVDGSERMQLTTPPLRAGVPSWSPDGRQIAFSGQISPGYSKIFVVPADGGQPKIVAQAQFEEGDPTWTLEGNSLIFGGSMWSAETKIFSVDLKSGGISTVPGSDHMFSPRLSPNGRFIVAMDAPGKSKLFLFDQQTQKWSELAAGEGLSPDWPRWSTDSQYVYFSPTTAGRVRFVDRVGVTDHKRERVASIDLPEGTVGIFGHWIGLAPDGTPLLLRNQSIQEIYALDVDLP
jgi:Tol biopolymer transport system component/DNA-binding winged helix-turn-helix (wHTH) protein